MFKNALWFTSAFVSSVSTRTMHQQTRRLGPLDLVIITKTRRFYRFEGALAQHLPPLFVSAGSGPAQNTSR